MSGQLTLCGTPIGNLEDISLRVLRILKEADVIAAEDTRHTLKLLNHYRISKPLISYHHHNRVEQVDKILNLLNCGKSVALVTDAGMPCISDPGWELVARCHQEQISVTAAPGPTAVTTALALSGLPGRLFTFVGFLPVNKKERRLLLEELRTQPQTIVFYEAPHHLRQTLNVCHEVLGRRKIAVVREMTKKYEQVQHFYLDEATAYFKTNEPKGEYVCVLEGMQKAEQKQAQSEQWAHVDIKEHITLYESQGLTTKEAMKAVAKDRGVSKSHVYKQLL